MAYEVDGQIKLIKKISTVRSASGFPVYQEQAREVPAKIQTISQNEFFSAGQSGIASEYLFKINPVEYQGERTVEYEGDILTIYRKYRSGMDVLELYAGKEVGTV